jgi:hypothetical protein
MRVVFVNSPMQSPETINKQLVEGGYPDWCVRSERMKVGETFQQWWFRKKEYIKNNPAYDIVEGIYFYDIMMIGDIVGRPNEAAGIVRYDWIKKQDEKK